MHRLKEYLLVIACVCPASSQTAPGWRFWSTADGLRESYTSRLVIGPGAFFAKHGDVETLSKLDGYQVIGIPDPGALGAFAAGADGDLWLLARTNLRRFHESKWTIFDLPEFRAWGFESDSEQQWRTRTKSDATYAGALCPLGGGRVLLLLPDRILAFDANTRISQIFRLSSATRLTRFSRMYPGVNGRIWVSGRRGIATISTPAISASTTLTSVKRDWPDSLEWVDHPGPPGFFEFEEVHEAEQGGAIVVASSGNGKSALRFNGEKWSVLYTTRAARLRAWQGADDDVWIQDGDAILRLTGSGSEAADRQMALSGRIMAVTTETGGAFWLGSSQGIARYAPPLWRTPRALRHPQLDSFSTGIAEDHHGNLWFLNRAVLVRFDGTGSKIYPLPNGYYAPDALTDTLRILPDGMIALLPEHSREALIFDPRRGRFSTLRHPEGRILRLFGSSRRGGILVQTVDPRNTKSFRLETLDASSFKPYADAGPAWDTNDLRTICETSSGDIRLGSTSTLGVYHNGSYRSVGKDQGYGERGAFFIFEASPGRLLVGGRDELSEFDGRRWTVIQKGLDRVRSMIRTSDGNIWAASGTGVHRYLPGRWITNGTEEGLPASVAHKLFQDSHGRIWVGTTRGISLFHPDADPDPPVTLMSEDRNAREVTPDGQIPLVFAGIDKFKQTPPERLLYSNRIDGGGWSAFDSGGSALFRALPRGAHRFEVRAMDRNGNIDPKGASFIFRVQMPWYQNREFRLAATAVGCIFALLLILQSYRRGRLIQQLRRARKVELARKEILEMIARREPLDSILSTITRAVEENAPGCRCGISVLNQATHPADVPGSSEPTPALVGMSVEFPIVGRHGEIAGGIELHYRDARASRPTSDVVEVMVALAAASIENERLYKELERQAKFDPLTGALNRLYFREQVAAALSRNASGSQEFALLCVDVDRFKQLNDSLGHSVGDEILRDLAWRIAGFVGRRGAVGRMGGDEFTVLLTDCGGAESIRCLVQQLLEILRRPLLADGGQIFPSVSIGISVFPGDGEDFTALHKNADCALYRAKELGKSRFEFFSSELKTAAVQALEIERDLHLALKWGWFELHYQPQYTMDGAVVGAEALIRLRHPEKGLILPGKFISVAEDCGLIVEIGQWTIREACRQRAEWDRLGYRPLKVAVNVSARQFARPDFANSIAATLHEYALSGNAIEIELTESVILTNLEAAVTQMTNLRALGLTIAIDDFGTGYSSLSYLHQLPINVLKLDRSFVGAIDHDLRRMELVRSIVDLAHNLSLSTVAEGVERRAELKYLQKIGCDLAQGYLFSEPLPACAMESLLRMQPAPVPLLELEELTA